MGLLPCCQPWQLGAFALYVTAKEPLSRKPWLKGTQLWPPRWVQVKLNCLLTNAGPRWPKGAAACNPTSAWLHIHHEEPNSAALPVLFSNLCLIIILCKCFGGQALPKALGDELSLGGQARSVAPAVTKLSGGS